MSEIMVDESPARDLSKLEIGQYSVESFQVPVPAGDCSIHLLVKDPPESTNKYWDKFDPSQHDLTDATGLGYVRGLERLGTIERGTILRAVLVDGGYDGDRLSGGKAANAIRTVIKTIETDFNMTSLKFDAWVVTHWDRDHYCGTLQMLVDDLTDQYLLQSMNPTATGAKDEQRIKSTYFKYEAGEPTTIMYCPVFELTDEQKEEKEEKQKKKEEKQKEKEQAKAKAKEAKQAKQGKQGKQAMQAMQATKVTESPSTVVSDSPHWRLRRSEPEKQPENQIQVEKTGQANFVDVMVAFRDVPEPNRGARTDGEDEEDGEDGEEAESEDEEKRKKKKGGKKQQQKEDKSKGSKLEQKVKTKKTAQEQKDAALKHIYRSLNRSLTKNPVDAHWQPRICKIVAGWDQLRGRDFFSGESKIDNDVASIPFKDLVKGIAGTPAFLCVGAEGYLLNKARENQNQRRETHKKTVAAAKNNRKAAQNERPPETAKPWTANGDTWENYISIMSLIVWPPSPRNGENGRISYFCGGDANAVSEKELAEWLDGYSVAVLKASHHGAHTATPPELLKKLHPDKVLLPAGYEYGHPNWTVMALLFAYWQYNVARLEGQPDALTKIEKLALPLRFPYYLESRNYKRKDSSTLLRQVDLNPSNVPNYTDLFDKFKKSSMETSSPQLTQWMNQTYNEGFFRELNVADAIILCKKIAGVADKAGKADKLADVKFLEGQTKDEGWLKQLNSDVEEFKGILTGKTKKKEKRKKKDDSESKKKPKKKPNFDEEVNEFRDLRIQQYLAIMMLKEYWGFISSMDANYGRKQLGKPGYKQPRYLWTRSCDNTLLDGRVVPFVSNQEGLPIREEPTTNPNGSVTMQMNIEVPSISPLSQEQAADEGQQIQAKNLSDFIDANLSIVIDEFDWSDEIRSEGDYSESETEEDSKEASLISGRRGWVGGKDISKTRVVERGETERLAVRTRKFR